MAEWYQVLEIAGPDGRGTGRFRYTRRTDDPPLGPYGLCEHEHSSVTEAEACPDIQEVLDATFPNRRHRKMVEGDL